LKEGTGLPHRTKCERAHAGSLRLGGQNNALQYHSENRTKVPSELETLVIVRISIACMTLQYGLTSVLAGVEFTFVILANTGHM